MTDAHVPPEVATAYIVVRWEAQAQGKSLEGPLNIYDLASGVLVPTDNPVDIVRELQQEAQPS